MSSITSRKIKTGCSLLVWTLANFCKEGNFEKETEVSGKEGWVAFKEVSIKLLGNKSIVEDILRKYKNLDWLNESSFPKFTFELLSVKDPVGTSKKSQP